MAHIGYPSIFTAAFDIAWRNEMCRVNWKCQSSFQGLPLHVQIDTYEDAKDIRPTHRGFCQVKVFCDKVGPVQVSINFGMVLMIGKLPIIAWFENKGWDPARGSTGSLKEGLWHATSQLRSFYPFIFPSHCFVSLKLLLILGPTPSHWGNFNETLEWRFTGCNSWKCAHLET